MCITYLEYYSDVSLVDLKDFHSKFKVSKFWVFVPLCLVTFSLHQSSCTYLLCDEKYLNMVLVVTAVKQQSNEQRGSF